MAPNLHDDESGATRKFLTDKAWSGTCLFSGLENMSFETGMLVLRSGRWRWHIEESSHGEFMEAIDPGQPANKLIVSLPFSWRQLSQEQLTELARKPQLRLWEDGLGVFWRVAAIGPGTPYDFPLHMRHLLFDSEQAWAGIAEFPEDAELGDLTSTDLTRLRDSIRDLGGRRRRFRPSA